MTSRLDDVARALLAERFGPPPRRHRDVDDAATCAARRAALLADLDRLPVDRAQKVRRLRKVAA